MILGHQTFIHLFNFLANWISEKSRIRHTHKQSNIQNTLDLTKYWFDLWTTAYVEERRLFYNLILKFLKVISDPPAHTSAKHNMNNETDKNSHLMVRKPA